VEPVDLGGEGDARYLVMELVEGETLAALLERRGRLSPREIAAIFLPICSAIAAAHDLGVVHRDLKPSNIILARGPGGRLWPKVLDFGVSKWNDASSEGLTRSGTVVGTVSYVSPEIARGAADVTGQSDVYSLGIILFQCATGEPPFRGESSYEVMHAIVTRAAPSPSSVVADLPSAFDEMVRLALERDREIRFASVRALGRHLLVFADPEVRLAWQAEFEEGTALQSATAAERPALATLSEEALAVLWTPTPSNPLAKRRVVARGIGPMIGVALALGGAVAIGVVRQSRVTTLEPPAPEARGSAVFEPTSNAAVRELPASSIPTDGTVAQQSAASAPPAPPLPPDPRPAAREMARTSPKRTLPKVAESAPPELPPVRGTNGIPIFE
jgi:serine/threonine-protein kinase